MKLIDILKEDLVGSLSRPGYLDVSVSLHNHKRRSSDAESITTSTPYPLRSTSSKTRGVPIYYAYSYISSDEVTNILKSIKGSGEYKVEEKQKRFFIQNSVEYLVSGFNQLKIKPDILIFPTSSSQLVKDTAIELANKLNCEIASDAFLKKNEFDIPEDKAAALSFIKAELIDKDYLDSKWTKSEEEKEEFLDRIAKGLLSNIKKYGTLQVKGVDKQIGKFVKGFLKLNTDEYQILEKNVMIFDDVLSSGATMGEMIRIAKEECLAESVIGCVLFSNTSASK